MTIRRRKDGAWVVRYYADGTKAGARVLETLWGETQPNGRLRPLSAAEAQAIYAERQNRARRSKAEGTIGMKISFDALADEYLKLHGPKLSKIWRKETESILDRHFRPRFGRRLADSLRPLDGERFMAERQAEGVSSATLRRELAVLLGVLSKGVLWRLLDRHPIPARSIVKPKLGEGRLDFFEPGEWQRFIGVFDDRDLWGANVSKLRRWGPILAGAGGAPGARRYGAGRLPESEASDKSFESFRAAKPVFEALLLTGSRLGEITGLRWSTVDLQRGMVRIEQSKTGQAKTLPISANLRRVFQAVPPGVGEALVFRRRSGAAWEKSRLSKMFNLAKDLVVLRDERAGVPEEKRGIRDALVIHSLRHTFASWLAIEGVPLRTIQEMLGHRSSKMTERYSHLQPVHLAGAADLVGRIASGEVALVGPTPTTGASMESRR